MGHSLNLSILKWSANLAGECGLGAPETEVTSGIFEKRGTESRSILNSRTDEELGGRGNGSQMVYPSSIREEMESQLRILKGRKGST